MSSASIGEKIGSYRLLRLLGEGGMGSVFEALHEGIERRAAIKLLHPALGRDAAMVARFFNEARGANIIRHPGVVSIVEFGTLPDGTSFIVMELLEGQSLAARLRAHRRLGWGPEALLLMRQIASVLVAAHDKGVIHRDLKPDNLMLVPDPETPTGERVKVLDFGIAKIDPPTGDAPAQVRTHAGAIMGTPAYMSPEQCRDAATATARSDVYSLGVICFEIVTGRRPFEAGDAISLMGMQMYNEPPSPQRIDPTMPTALAELILQMLAKDAAWRPSARDVVARLEALGAWAGTRPHEMILEPLPAGPGPAPAKVSTLPQAGWQLVGAPAARSSKGWLIGGVGLGLGAGVLAAALAVDREAPAPREAPPAPRAIAAEPRRAATQPEVPRALAAPDLGAVAERATQAAEAAPPRSAPAAARAAAPAPPQRGKAAPATTTSKPRRDVSNDELILLR